MTLPEVLAMVLYGLTILPSCILAIWYRKGPAVWLIEKASIITDMRTMTMVDMLVIWC